MSEGESRPERRRHALPPALSFNYQLKPSQRPVNIGLFQRRLKAECADKKRVFDTKGSARYGIDGATFPAT